jgi:hypothetical protein
VAKKRSKKTLAPVMPQRIEFATRSAAILKGYLSSSCFMSSKKTINKLQNRTPLRIADATLRWELIRFSIKVAKRRYYRQHAEANEASEAHQRSCL